MTTMTVSSKGQVVIPMMLRRRLGIRQGTRLEIQRSAEGGFSVKVVAAAAPQLCEGCPIAAAAAAARASAG